MEYAAEASFLSTAPGTVCAGAARIFARLGVAAVSGRIGMRPPGEPFSGFRAVLTLGIAGIPAVTAFCWAGFAWRASDRPLSRFRRPWFCSS